MSITLSRVRSRIRGRLNDVDLSHPAYSTIQYDQAIASAYLICQARLPAPYLYSAAAVTIAAGGDTFTLPTTVTQWTGGDGQAEYAGDVRLRLTSNGQWLEKITVEQLDALRDGEPEVRLSIPFYFALWEDKDQVVQGRCHPGAASTETCDLFHTLTADDLRDYVGSGSDDMDDVSVNFSRIAAQALELYTAADLLGRMPKDKALRLELDKSIAGSWRAEADVMSYREEARRHDLEQTGEIQRWEFD